MKKHTKMVASLVVAGALAFGAPAAAQAYPAPAPDAPAVSGSLVPGGTAAVAFGGFDDGETVEVSLTGESALSATLASIVRTAVETKSATYQAADDGSVVVNVTLPANASGTYTLTATGSTSGLVQTATLSVGAAAGTGASGADGNLAATGGSDMTALWVGGGALLLTGGAVLAATTIRRRQHRDS